jgi:hypothetical protein
VQLGRVCKSQQTQLRMSHRLRHFFGHGFRNNSVRRQKFASLRRCLLVYRRCDTRVSHPDVVYLRW